MKITKEEVQHVALLARLNLSEAEVDEYTGQLNNILGYAQMLNQLDTDDVIPTAHAVELYNVLREDEVRPSMDQHQALQNAPAADKGFFRVPRIV